MPAEDHVGLTGPAYDMEIERGHILDFSRAMLAPVPEFIETPQPVIPATFLATAQYTWGYSLERPRGTVFETIDHDLSVPLHAEEEYIFHNLPRAGDRLICQSSLENVARKQGGNGGELTFLTVVTEYRDPAGEIIAEQRATTVTTQNAPDDAAWDATAPPYRPGYRGLDPIDPFTEIERVGWDHLSVGHGPGEMTPGPLLIGDIVRFQGVIGEDSPLHNDEAYAAASGYPAVFGLGMHQASILAGYAAHWLNPMGVRMFKARFLDVYWPGDLLVYEGLVTQKTVDSGRRIAEVELVCRRAGGDPVVRAWMALDVTA